MQNLNCLSTVVTDGLAIYIDISDSRSWNLNTGLTSVSITEWDNAKSSTLSLPDFGLTGFDNGRTTVYTGATLSFTPNDTQLTLYRVGYNNATGGTFYNLYPMSAVTSTASTVGNYFSLNGGYLQGFFKLHDYEYELFPRRYNNGITIETIINITSESFTNDGIFFLMGVRAEDKYNPSLTGESRNVVTTVTAATSGGVQGQTTIISKSSTGFTGYQTSEDNYLNAWFSANTLENGINSFDNGLQFKQSWSKAQPFENIAQNVIALALRQDGRLSYKTTDISGNTVIKNSDNAITSTGWTIISMSFSPYSVFEDEDLLECKNNRRKGTMIIYVDGRSFWRVEDFDEFYFNEIANHKEKQIGVPYNISWGGGSFGLKHSYHFENVFDSGNTNLIQDSRKQSLEIETNFNNSFLGDIQKLRIYDRALNSQEILHNAIIEANNTSGYLININRGGRIIYR